jgi:hypothetical protein
MIRLGTMIAVMLVMLTAGSTAHAEREMRTFLCWRGPGPTMSIPRPMVRCGSPRNPRANSAGSILGPAGRI